MPSRSNLMRPKIVDAVCISTWVMRRARPGSLRPSTRRPTLACPDGLLVMMRGRRDAPKKRGLPRRRFRQGPGCRELIVVQAASELRLEDVHDGEDPFFCRSE